MTRAAAQLVVIGAGPAGLAAARAAADRGVDVVLIDSAATLGGQIWRQPVGDLDAAAPQPLQAVAGHPRIEVRPATEVVHAATGSGGTRLLLRDAAGAHAMVAPALVLATGASELSLPFPGWDLPGVMTPGAAQAMLKAHDVSPGRRAVVAGTGAFLWPVAAALVTAGVEVAAVIEAVPLTRSARRCAGLARHPSVLRQAGGYLRTVLRARVPLLTGWAVVAAHGSDQVESATVARLDGAGRAVSDKQREFAVDTACVGWGFVPSMQLARSLGCVEQPHPNRPHSTVIVDGSQATSVPGVFAAGELTGIGGAVVASAEGEIAGAAAAAWLTSSDAESGLHRARSARRRAQQVAAILDRAYPIPARWTERLQDDTLVCRCEEVNWTEVRRVVEDGITTARGVKGQLRCGMGWCQGRVCGPAVQLAVARRADRPLDEVGELGGGPFAIPLTVGELAAVDRPRQRG